MKKILTLGLLAISAAVSANALIIGNTGGYLLDRKRPYVTARIGGAFESDTMFEHLGELEIGYTYDSNTGIKTHLIPVTLNYRGQFSGAGILGGYFGIGGGMAQSRISTFGATATAWSGAAQGFAGISFKVFRNASIDLGGRYIRINDVTLFGVKVPVKDDTVVEAGFHYRF